MLPASPRGLLGLAAHLWRGRAPGHRPIPRSKREGAAGGQGGARGAGVWDPPLPHPQAACPGAAWAGGSPIAPSTSTGGSAVISDVCFPCLAGDAARSGLGLQTPPMLVQRLVVGRAADGSWHFCLSCPHWFAAGSLGCFALLLTVPWRSKSHNSRAASGPINQGLFPANTDHCFPQRSSFYRRENDLLWEIVSSGVARARDVCHG